jgi:signal transduction histidine kinase
VRPSELPRASSRHVIEALTGIRSSKRTFYVEYRSAEEHLERSVGSLERVAHVLSAGDKGIEPLCAEVLSAMAEHLRVQRAALLVDATTLPDATVHRAALGADGRATLDALGNDDLLELRGHLDALVGQAREDPFLRDGLCLTPLSVDGAMIGLMAAWVPGQVVLPPADRAVLHILGSQVAVALRNDDLLRRSERLRVDAELQTLALARHHRELDEATTRLGIVEQHAVIEAERRRMARELHDSVAQHMLSAGMTIEWCRAELSEHAEVSERLMHAKQLTRTAIDRLRTAIAALTSDTDTDEDLPGMLHRLVAVQRSAALDIQVRVEGRPVTLPPAVAHALLRIAGEAVLNASRHGEADRIILRLAYRPASIRLSVADNGRGQPEALRRHLEATRLRDDGYHRGLHNMTTRATELGGSLRFLRARLGGIRVLTELPLPNELEAT